MWFKVVAKRYGDSVEFGVEAVDTKAVFQASKKEASNITGELAQGEQ